MGTKKRAGRKDKRRDRTDDPSSPAAAGDGRGKGGPDPDENPKKKSGGSEVRMDMRTRILLFLLPLVIVLGLYLAAELPAVILYVLGGAGAAAGVLWCIRKPGKRPGKEPDTLEAALIEGRFTAVFENSPVMMVLLDERIRVQRANTAAAHFSNRSARSLLGLSQGELLKCFRTLENARGCGTGICCGTCT